uniref:non-specific serine/threonine protein kinase n=1 Tax=viral metagenome TaxID=1070528 RepID=A0A6C0H813_9ZZZZ
MSVDLSSHNSFTSSETDTIVTSSSSDKYISESDNLDLYKKCLRNYNIIIRIGEGACSIVWLVFNTIDKKCYALKVQNPNEYETGLDEIKFVKKLPKLPLFNNIIEYFIEEINDLKYLCSIWNLYKCNLDTIIRNGPYTNGLPFNISLNILTQIASGLQILHNKFKVFHGDVKTDNILVEGINTKYDTFYKKYLELYETLSHEQIIDIIENIDINDNYELINENCIVSLSDFGAYCKINMKHSETFGTRYYQAPEIILLGNCTYAVDIWALGCTLFEILTGDILFDPNKDAYNPRDYYHLCLINETCGDFPYYFLKKTKKYKLFFDSKFKIKNFNIEEDNRLERKLSVITLPNLEMKLIKKLLINMLQIYYKDRSNIDNILLEITNFNNK